MAASYRPPAVAESDPVAGVALGAHVALTTTAHGIPAQISTAITAHIAVTDPHGDRVYADGLIAANDALVYKGAINASANPTYPAASAGHFYKISAAGKIGGASGATVEVGDSILCTLDGSSAGTQAAVGANWSIIQTNIDGAVIGPASATDGDLARFDGVGGKLVKAGLALDTDGTLAANSDAKVPSQKAVKAALDLADSSAVKLTGAQTITGPKTFKNSAAGAAVIVQKAASNRAENLHEFLDENGVLKGRVRHDGVLELGGFTPGAGAGLKLISISSDGSVAPEMHFHALNGRTSDKMAWGIGIDVAATVPSRDLAIFKANEGGGVTDFMYFNHGGSAAPRVGVGLVPPNFPATMQISAPDAAPSWAVADTGRAAEYAGFGIRVNQGLSAMCPVAFFSSADGSKLAWVDNNLRHRVKAGSQGTEFQAESTNGDVQTWHTGTAGEQLCWRMFAGGYLRLRHPNSGNSIVQFGSDKSAYFYGDVTIAGNVGFHGVTGGAKPTISGSRAGNAAVADLLTKLAATGLIADGTVA